MIGAGKAIGTLGTLDNVDLDRHGLIGDAWK